MIAIVLLAAAAGFSADKRCAQTQMRKNSALDRFGVLVVRLSPDASFYKLDFFLNGALH